MKNVFILWRNDPRADTEEIYKFKLFFFYSETLKKKK